ncbi:hypothetical protein ACWCV9_33515 [Streptomyces sp. NPDC001606]
MFGVSALATLVAGVVIERSGEEFCTRQGLSGVLFGATVLAAATSLPEVSTGLTSTKLGDHQLALSDIFGGNASLPVLFLLATVISGKPVLPAAHDTDIHLTGLGIILTIVHMGWADLSPTPSVAVREPETVVIVACLLLPVVAVLLYGMDRVEDWLSRTPRPPRHSRTRHLRLIEGGRQGSLTHPQTSWRRPAA